jgi:hypothetical protein
MADTLSKTLNENPLIALRKRKDTGTSDNKLVQMRMSQPNDTFAKQLEAENNPRNQPDANPDDIKRSALMAQYNKLPFLQKFNTGMDDIFRTGLSDLSGGLYDYIDPEAANARSRMGSAALPIDVIGALRSPITKVIGAGAKVIRPTAEGFLPAAGRLLVSGGEGAALGGTEALIRSHGDLEKAKQNAEIGGGLSMGAEALMSHILPGIGKTVASAASSVPKKTMEDTFSIAAGSKAGSDAISAVRAGRAPVALDDQIIALRKKLGQVDLIPSEKAILQKALDDAEARFKTTSGMTDLDATDATNMNRLQNSAVDKSGKTPKWLINHLDDLAAFLQNSKVTNAEATSTSGRAVGDVHNIAKDLGTKVDPRFGTLMDLVNTLNKARSAGTKTKNWRPEKSGIGTMLQAGSVAGSPLLHYFGFDPMISLGAAGVGLASWLASSPKLIGKTAQTAGNVKRVLGNAVETIGGSKPTYGQLGLVADPVAKKLGLNKGQR